MKDFNRHMNEARIAKMNHIVSQTSTLSPFMLFPIRLETHFRTEKVSAKPIHEIEIEAVFNDFTKVFDTIKNFDINTDNYQATLTELLYDLGVKIIELDLLPSEDKSVVVALAKSLYKVFKTFNQNKSYSELSKYIDHIVKVSEDIETSTALKRNDASVFIKDLDKQINSLNTLIEYRKTPYGSVKFFEEINKQLKFQTTTEENKILYQYVESRLVQLRTFFKEAKNRVNNIPSLDQKQRKLLTNKYKIHDVTYWKNKFAKVQNNLIAIYTNLTYQKNKLTEKYTEEWYNILNEVEKAYLDFAKDILKQVDKKAYKTTFYTSIAQRVISLSMDIWVAKSSKKHLPFATLLRKSKSINNQISTLYIAYESEEQMLKNLLKKYNKSVREYYKQMSEMSYDDYINNYKQAQQLMLSFDFNNLTTAKKEHFFNENQLCVRIYPDEIFIHQHDYLLTKQEYEDAIYFWLSWFIASGNSKYEKEAWNRLCLKYDVMRASWITRKLRPKNLKSYLKHQPFKNNQDLEKLADQLINEINLFELSDESSKTQEENEQALIETINRLRPIFYKLRGHSMRYEKIVDFYFQNIEQSLSYLKRKLASLIQFYNRNPLYKEAPYMAFRDPDFSSLNTFYKEVEDLSLHLKNHHISLDQMIEEYKERYLKDDHFFPNIARFREEDEFMLPVSNILPDRFLFFGISPITYRTKVKDTQITYAGRRIKSNLQLGFNPFEDPDINPYDLNMETGEVDVRGGIKWMVDYEAAVRSGMAITIPLPHSKENFKSASFKSIYVLGIKNKIDEKALHDFFTGHIYGQTGLDFLDIGTPTNNFDGILSTYTTDKELLQERRYEIEVEEKFKENSEALFQAISFLFGMSKNHFHETLARTNSFDNKEIKKAITVNENIGKSIKDKFKVNGSSDFAKNTTDFLKQIPCFVSNYSLARGIFPPLRIGNQPYGLLPTTAFSKFKIEPKEDTAIKYNVKQIYQQGKKNDRFDSFEEEQKFLNFARQLYPLLKEITTVWTKIKEESVIHSKNLHHNKEGEQNTNVRFVEMATTTPTIVSFFIRNLTTNINSNLSYARLLKEDINLAKIIQDIFNLDGDRKSIETEVKSQLLSLDILQNSRVILKDDNEKEPNLKTFIEQDLKTKIPSGFSEKEFHLLAIEFMDLFTYRLDAWWLGLVNYQLDRIRRGHFGKETEPVQIGAFGWLFDLKKKTKSAIPSKDHLKIVQDLKLPNPEQPIYKDENYNEYFIAPSINHAATAAVLRSNYLKEQKDLKIQNKEKHCINLSSLRVRQALRLMEGVRNGLSLGAILGADLERAIHENYKIDGLELDRYIYLLREKFPLKAQTEGKNDKQEDSHQMELINAELLLESFMDQFDDSDTTDYIADYLINDKVTWFKNLFINRPKSHKERIARLIEQIADAYDAVGDLVLSEGVYQLVRGNRVAFSSWMKNLEDGNFSTNPEFIEIPMHSAMIEHKIGLVFTNDREVNNLSEWNRNMYKSIAGDSIDIDEREWLLAQLEPAFHRYVAEQIGEAKKIGFTVKFEKDEEEHSKFTCSIEDLAISPLELLYLSSNERLFKTYLEWLLRQKHDWFQGKLTIDFEANLSDDNKDMRNIYTYQLQLNNLRPLLSKNRVLKPSDFSHISRENESLISSSFDLEEFSSRYQLLRNYYEKLLMDIKALGSKAQRSLNDENRRIKFFQEFIEILINISSLGTTYSLSSLSSQIFHEKTSEEKIQQITEIQEHLTELHRLLSNKLTNATQKISESDTTNEESYFLTIQESIKELTDAHFKVIPLFKMDTLLEQERKMLYDQLKPDFQYVNTNSLDMEKWFTELSKVRKSVKELHEIRMFTEFNNDGNSELRALQFPYDAESDTEWLGRELSSEEKIKDKKSLVLLNSDALLEPQTTYFSGLLIDQWMEMIPYKNQEGGLVMQFDQPDAEAPQSILLVLPAQINLTYKKEGYAAKKWTLNEMILALEDTKKLAENRAVEPQHIEKNEALSRIFPLLKFEAK